MATKKETTEKQVQITLDDTSVEVLKSVNSIHRESLINLGIALVSKTPYYQTLTGNIPEKLKEITSLAVGTDSLDEDEDDDDVVEEVEETTTSTATWDNF